MRRIHVRLALRAPEAGRAAAERAHAVFASACPIYQTLKGSIAITTELAFEAE